MLEGILGLVGVVLGSTGLIWYRLGKLTSTVKLQGDIINKLVVVVLNEGSNPGRKKPKKRKGAKGG
jgi:hypothetical protein